MLITAALFFLNSATAAPVSMTQAEEVARKLERHKNQVVEKEKQQRQILSGLFEINQKIKKLSKEKSDLENEKKMLEFSIADLKKRNEELSESLKVKGRFLTTHVRWLQQAKDFSWLNTISGSKGPTEADLNFYIFSKLMAQEKVKIREYFLEKKQLSKNEKKLLGRLERLNKISKDLLQKEGDFLLRQTERKTALNQIKSQKSQVLQKIQSLKNSVLAQKLDDTGLLDGLIRASFEDEKGQLKIPVSGILKQRFGIVKASDSSYYKNHKGIFIQTRPGTDVTAVFEGKVAYTGTIGGFGKTLILDHGDHYYTVYSSLASLDVTEGQLISKDQALGKAGASHFYKDQGIYFEIRHFSEPQDPQEWVKKGTL
jgi:septal ring factor EnvC (AmiA/AmiB activator)